MCGDLHKDGVDKTQAEFHLIKKNTSLSRRYHRLPLPMEGAPLEEDFDAFVNILRVSSCKHHSYHTDRSTSAQVHQSNSTAPALLCWG